MFARRVRFMLLFILAGFFVLWGRLAWLQLWRCRQYRGQSERYAIHTEEIVAFRGSIRDRHGVPLAMDKPCFDLVVRYKRLKKPGPWREYAREVTHLDLAEIDAAARRVVDRVEALRAHLAHARGRPFRKKERIYEETIAHPIATDIGLEATARFRLHQERYEPDIAVEVKSKRQYPQGDMAAHLIGYMQRVNAREAEEYREEYDGYPEKSYRPSEKIGRAGLERSYNRRLRGQRGERIIAWAARHRHKVDVILEKPPVAGDDVYITLDTRIQRAAEAALGEQAGAVVVIEPKTGHILALASSPRYNLNTFREHYGELAKDKEKAPLIDRALRGLLPPGSVFKIVTACAGLEHHKLMPSDRYYCPGYVRVGDVTLRCWATYGHGALGLHEALVHSCNVYFFRVAGGLHAGGGLTSQEMGETARRFGFGRRVAKDVAAEISKPFPTLRSRADRMNSGCGQGALVVTPLQVAAMAATIANRGVQMQPYLTRRIVSQGRQVVLDCPRGAPRRVVSEQTAQIIASAMIDVSRRGTARGQGLERFKAACKTGTAQTSKTDVNHAWLAGYAPYDDPKYAFAVVCEKVSGHGGEVAGPVAAKMLALIASDKVAVAPAE